MPYTFHTIFSISQQSLMPAIRQACQYTHLAKRLTQKVVRRQGGEDYHFLYIVKSFTCFFRKIKRKE